MLVCTRFHLCPPTLGSLFPPVLLKTYNEIMLAFKARVPGDSVPLSDPQAGKPDVGFRTFTTVGELLWYYCSPVYGSPTQQVWDLTLLWLHTFYHLAVAPSLSLDMKYLLLVGSRVLLLMVVQQLVAILVFLQEEMNTHPSTLPFWTGASIFLNYSFCLGMCPGVRMLDHMATPNFSFLRNLHSVLHPPPNNVGGLHFLYIFSSISLF